jgi:MoaA/NifB/PqqE/SkfB family radical SAM enzyme
LIPTGAGQSVIQLSTCTAARRLIIDGVFGYLGNLVRLLLGKRALSPLAAAYYLTMQCNLNCAYCEDFGSRRNGLVLPGATPEQAMQILRVVRTGIPRLWLTGGEPLTCPYLSDLLAFARHELKFREISLITNGTLLSQNTGLLRYLDRLIISLDSLDPRSLLRVNLPETHAQAVIENVRQTASLRREHKFSLMINAVITPETLAGMDSLLDFCIDQNIRLSFSPQSVNNLPRYELVTCAGYRAFIEKAIRLKQRGAPILGSLAYLRTLLDQRPYECHPTLIPRILPDGSLAYPCRPIERSGGGQGGRAVNLLEVENWKEAWRTARETYGEAPSSCASCFQQCYAEPSLMQAHPVEFLREMLRGANLTTYAAG